MIGLGIGFTLVNLVLSKIISYGRPVAYAWLLVLFAALGGAYWAEGRMAEALSHGWAFVMVIGLAFTEYK